MLTVLQFKKKKKKIFNYIDRVTVKSSVLMLSFDFRQHLCIDVIHWLRGIVTVTFNLCLVT